MKVAAAAHALAEQGYDSGPASSRLNALRAAVLGANDGIVSTAGLVVGVAGATESGNALAMAGIAGLAAGALSMAAGEYVSVSAQRDSEQAAVAQELRELKAMPEQEFQELVSLLEQRGLTPATAFHAARELTEKDALAAHAEVELGLRLGQYTNPWEAALSSALSFIAGALVPLLTMWLAPPPHRVAMTFVAVLLALLLTGVTSARLGRAPVLPAAVRNVVGGALAMAVTYGIGQMVGTHFGN